MRTKFLITIFVWLSLNSCNFNSNKSNINNYSSKDENIKIAITKASGSLSYKQYARWVHQIDKNAVVIDLIRVNPDSLISVFNRCSGLIISGGPDINPGRYGKEDLIDYCGEIDNERDSLEFMVLKEALSKKMPVFGICRGHQLINVHLNGNLYVDIKTDFKNSEKHRCTNPDNCFHEVEIDTNSMLAGISESSTGMVNSNHHQAIEKLGDGLVISAKAKDGVIEAVEWENPDNKSFLISVQWHPERLHSTNELSWEIGKRFLEESYLFQKRNN